MAEGFGDQSYAIRFRDAVTAIAQGVVDRMRPEVRLAKVYSVDISTMRADVLFPGEVYPNTITAKMSANLVPSVVMETSYGTSGMDAPGDIVRIAGKPGSYYIDSFVSGQPSIMGLLDTAVGRLDTAEDRLDADEALLYKALPVPSLASVTSPTRGLIVHDLSLNSFYGYDGTQWHFLGGQPGWHAFPGAGGWQAYTSPYGSPNYRLEGNRVFFAGLLQTNTSRAPGVKIATGGLPAPGAQRVLTTTAQNLLARVDVLPNGSMDYSQGPTIPSGGYLTLDGLFYDL